MSLFYQKVGYFILFYAYFITLSADQTLISYEPDLSCRQSIYKTTQTKCEISRSVCNDETHNKFLKCTRKSCMRHLGAYNCQKQLETNLNQHDCFWQCCKSQTFNQGKCQNFNLQLEQSQKTQDNLLLLIILISAGFLLIFTFFFFYNILKCKQSELFQQKCQSCINWVQSAYFDVKCDSCLLYGSMIVTPCNHSFHEQCYFKIVGERAVCPKCPQKMIGQLKIICNQCRQKHFKTKVTTSLVLKMILEQSKIQHINCCQKSDKQAKTDIRLTNSGSD